MIDPEAAFHVLARVVLGVLALAASLVLWWAARYVSWRLKA